MLVKNDLNLREAVRLSLTCSLPSMGMNLATENRSRSVFAYTQLQEESPEDSNLSQLEHVKCSSSVTDAVLGTNWLNMGREAGA